MSDGVWTTIGWVVIIGFILYGCNKDNNPDVNDPQYQFGYDEGYSGGYEDARGELCHRLYLMDIDINEC